MGTAKSKVSVIKTYFGMREGCTAKDFMQEYKDLSEEERLGLAQGAAKQLGLSASEVDFPLA